MGGALRAWQSGGVIRSLLANAAAFALATYLLPGITLEGDVWQAKAVSLLIVATVFSVLNVLVKPILWLVTSPIILLTLGLFLWVINAGMLMLTSMVSEGFAVDWRIDSWTSAFLGALIITVAGWITNGMLKKGKDRR